MSGTDKPLEKPLKGGSTTPVAKLGPDVLREAGPWTATVQKLLGHLRDQGVDWCPEPRGWHPDGRETLSYLKGKVPGQPLPDWVWSDEVLTQAARWLRQLHDATVDFDSPELTWRAPRHTPAEVVCHNDFGPDNFVFKDHRLTGVIDWDFASPGPRLWDLAYLAYRLVPLVGPTNPAGPTVQIDLLGRLTALLDAYGSDATPVELLTVVVQRLDELAAFASGRQKVMKNADVKDAAQRYAADAEFLRQLIR